MDSRPTDPVTMAPTWSILEHRGRAGLERLEADWRRLYAAMPLRSCFSSYEASLAYLNLIEAPDRLRCLSLTDGRQVRAICLLEPRATRVLGKRLRGWGVPWHRLGPPQADVLCPDDEARRRLIPALVAHLRRRPEGRQLLMLGPALASSSLWDGLGRLGRLVWFAEPGESVSVLDCRRSFDELRASIPRTWRHDLTKSQNRLSALRDVRFVVATEAMDLDAEFRTFLDVEASGWKGDGGTRTAILCEEAELAYFRDLVTNLRGDDDHCEIVALYAEGRCLSSQLTTRTGANYSLLKIGYDESFRRVSPGKLVVAKVVERCCEDPDIDQLDMVSDAPWLRGWRPDTVTTQLAYVAIGPLRGRASVALLYFRLGPARRFVRWLRAKRAR